MPADLSTPSIRPWRKTGEEFPCMICGKVVYRRASQIARGCTKTCGASACKSAAMSGKNNPFWGKEHPPEVRERIKRGRKLAEPHRRKSGPPKNPNRAPSKEQRERWVAVRDERMASLYKAKKNRPREKKRYRYCFTRWQRSEWLKPECKWCSSTESLVLDHILPVVCGGINELCNAQTLCQPCNLWKMVYVDRPLYLAGLGNQ